MMEFDNVPKQLLYPPLATFGSVGSDINWNSIEQARGELFIPATATAQASLPSLFRPQLVLVTRASSSRLLPVVRVATGQTARSIHSRRDYSREYRAGSVTPAEKKRGQANSA
jgi:hypothetical protein